MKLKDYTSYTSDLFFLTGIIFICVGVAFLFGWEYASIVAGVMFLIFGVLVAIASEK